MLISRILVVLMVIISSAILLTACDGSAQFEDLKSYIAKLKGEVPSGQSADKVPVLKPPVSAEYQASSKRSPFQVREITNTKKGVATNPLQAYPLDMLRFVGTVTQDGDSVAFISAPDNRIYQIRKGDKIGDREGEVVSIDSDSVTLNEPSSDNGDATMKRVVTLQLKEAGQ